MLREYARVGLDEPGVPFKDATVNPISTTKGHAGSASGTRRASEAPRAAGPVVSVFTRDLGINYAGCVWQSSVSGSVVAVAMRSLLILVFVVGLAGCDHVHRRWNRMGRNQQLWVAAAFLVIVGTPTCIWLARHSHRCARCRKHWAVRRSGACRYPEQLGPYDYEYEVRCNRCGHSEWRVKHHGSA